MLDLLGGWGRGGGGGGGMRVEVFSTRMCVVHGLGRGEWKASYISFSCLDHAIECVVHGCDVYVE